MFSELIVLILSNVSEEDFKKNGGSYLPRLSVLTPKKFFTSATVVAMHCEPTVQHENIDYIYLLVTIPKI